MGRGLRLVETLEPKTRKETLMPCKTVNTKDGAIVTTDIEATTYCTTCGKVCCNCELCIKVKGSRDICAQCVRTNQKIAEVKAAKKRSDA
jgi:hypothetical protein